jgi:hypothetical protein
MNDFEPQQMSTYALTLFKHKAKVDGAEVEVGASRHSVRVREGVGQLSGSCGTCVFVSGWVKLRTLPSSCVWDRAFGEAELSSGLVWVPPRPV